MQGLISQGQQNQEPQIQRTSRLGQRAQNNEEKPQNEDTDKSMLDIISSQMVSYLFEDKVYESIVKLFNGGDPAQTIAKIIGDLLNKVTSSAAMAGKKIPPKVLIVAGMEAARNLSAIGQKAGVLTKENEAEIVEAGFFQGIALFAQKAQEDALLPEEREEYAKLLELIEQKAEGKKSPNNNQSQPQQQQTEQAEQAEQITQEMQR